MKVNGCGRSTSICLVLSLVCLTPIGAQTTTTDHQHQKQVQLNILPAACSMLATDIPTDKNATHKERAYDETFVNFRHIWCTNISSTITEKFAAADAVASTWKELWDVDDPYNAVFHETGASDLLLLMDVTHRVPKPMQDDPKFMELWIAACERSCFTIFGNPADPKDQPGILRQLQLRNDVLHALEHDPKAKPIIEMLRNAQFRLVD